MLMSYINPRPEVNVFVGALIVFLLLLLWLCFSLAFTVYQFCKLPRVLDWVAVTYLNMLLK